MTVADGDRIRARGLTDGRGVFEAPGVGAAAAVRRLEGGSLRDRAVGPPSTATSRGRVLGLGRPAKAGPLPIR